MLQFNVAAFFASPMKAAESPAVRDPAHLYYEWLREKEDVTRSAWIVQPHTQAISISTILFVLENIEIANAD